MANLSEIYFKKATLETLLNTLNAKQEKGIILIQNSKEGQKNQQKA